MPNSIDTTIKAQALKMGMPETLANLIVGQARYETNDYTSNVFKTLNNAFGYKFVGQTKWPIGPGSTAPAKDAQGNADGGTYAKYKSVADSTGEIVDWIKRRQAEGVLNITTIQTPGQYAAALKRAGYYGQTASSYATGITAKLKNVAVAAGSGLAAVLIIAGFFF